MSESEELLYQPEKYLTKIHTVSRSATNKKPICVLTIIDERTCIDWLFNKKQIKHMYDIWIQNNILFGHTQQYFIIRFVKNQNVYKIYSSAYKSGNKPVLKIKIYETELEIYLYWFDETTKEFMYFRCVIQNNESNNKTLQYIEDAYLEFQQYVESRRNANANANATIY